MEDSKSLTAIKVEGCGTHEIRSRNGNLLPAGVCWRGTQGEHLCRGCSRAAGCTGCPVARTAEAVETHRTSLSSFLTMWLQHARLPAGSRPLGDARDMLFASYTVLCRTDLFCQRFKHFSNHMLFCCSYYPLKNILSCFQQTSVHHAS